MSRSRKRLGIICCAVALVANLVTIAFVPNVWSAVAAVCFAVALVAMAFVRPTDGPSSDSGEQAN